MGTTFNPGDRVTTRTEHMTGTVIEETDGVVWLEWDDDAGPQEDEVPAEWLHTIT